MADDTTITQGAGGDRIASDELATLNGQATVADSNGKLPKVQRFKLLAGDDGDGTDVSAAHPLPVTSPGGATASNQTSANTKLDTLHADLGTLATQTTLAAVLAKLSSDPATQTTLAAVLAKLTADPSTGAGQTTQGTKLDTLHTDLTSGGARIGGTVTTAPATAGDVATTLTDGRKTSTTPGTAVAIRTTLACKWVTVTALPTNAALVFVGGSAALATLGSERGQPLSAGNSITIPVDDASKVFVDVRTSGEGVTFTVAS